MPSNTSVNESFFCSREKTVGKALSEARNLFAGIKGDSPEIFQRNHSDRPTNEHRSGRMTKEDHSEETNERDWEQIWKCRPNRQTIEHLTIRKTKDPVHQTHSSEHRHSTNKSPKRSTDQNTVNTDELATNHTRTEGDRVSQSGDSYAKFRFDDKAKVRTNKDSEVRNSPVSAKPGNDAGGDRPSLAVRTNEEDNVVKVRRKMSYPENEISGDGEEKDRLSLPMRRRLPTFTVAYDRGKGDVKEDGRGIDKGENCEEEDEEEERSSENNLSDDQKIMTLKKPKVGVARSECADDAFDNVQRRDASRSKENATSVSERNRSNEGRSEKRLTRQRSNADTRSPVGERSLSRASSKRHGRDSPQRSKELVEDLEPQQQQQRRRSLVDHRCDVISVDEMTSWQEERMNTVLKASSTTCRPESPSKSAITTEALNKGEGVSSASRSTSMCGHVRKEDSDSPMKDASRSMVKPGCLTGCLRRCGYCSSLVFSSFGSLYL